MEQGFFAMGMDSLLAVELRNRLVTGLGVTVHATVAFDHPTVRRLSEYLANEVLLWAPKADSEISTMAPVEPLPEEDLDIEIQRRLTRLERLVRTAT
jgi:hypothetical protein